MSYGRGSGDGPPRDGEPYGEQPWGPPPGEIYPPPVYPPPGYYGYLPPPARSTNGLAIAALVVGILWIYWIGSILAVIFGHVALSQISRKGQGGSGMAIAGLVLGYIGLGFLLLFIGLGVTFS